VSAHPQRTIQTKTIATASMTLGDRRVVVGVVALSDGAVKRVISEITAHHVLSRGYRGRNIGSDKLAPFLAADNLNPFIPNELKALTNSDFFLIPFHTKGGPALGYPSDVIPLVCETYLDARRAGALRANQMHIAQRCETIVLAMARVGIVALIDEATGYQEAREKDDLQRLVNLYLAHEPGPWRKRFVDEFYVELHRVYDKQYDPITRARGSWVGRFTRQYIYGGILPDEVYTALCVRNPRVSETHITRRHAHHQLLSTDVGTPLLSARLTTVLHLLRQSANPRHFRRLFERGLPAGAGSQLRLVMED
jgi:P63C domain